MNTSENFSAPQNPQEKRGEQQASGMANMLGKSAVGREPLRVPVERVEERAAYDPHVEMFVNPDSHVEIYDVDTQPGELPNVAPDAQRDDLA